MSAYGFTPRDTRGSVCGPSINPPDDPDERRAEEIDEEAEDIFAGHVAQGAESVVFVEAAEQWIAEAVATFEDPRPWDGRPWDGMAIRRAHARALLAALQKALTHPSVEVHQALGVAFAAGAAEYLEEVAENEAEIVVDQRNEQAAEDHALRNVE